MSKNRSQFICQACGAVHSKWSGKCEDCGGWNCIAEEAVISIQSPSLGNSGTVLTCVTLDEEVAEAPRMTTTMGELDRVLGGGLVAGSVVLIGGDPGIGKSTILLQMLSAVSATGTPALYVSGEESIAQISLRAKRLGVSNNQLQMLAATHIESILNTINHSKHKVVVIDSIQTMTTDATGAMAGSVSQVRAAAASLVTLAKAKQIAIILVGHVTKDGQIAGPKVLEHMVDTVLYFEGERGQHFRLIRAVKNRFGAVNEIGVFEMQDAGLREVTNPSELFLANNSGPVSGSAIFPSMEGTRPVLVEIQALVAPTSMPTPRRAVLGWDANRLAMLIAVLSTRYNLRLGDKEVYLNVVGGLRVEEPAADLAVAAALISAARNMPLPERSVWFGEIGLSGEVRPVNSMEARLREAEKLGFTSAYTPKINLSSTHAQNILHIHPIQHIRQMLPSRTSEPAFAD